MLLIFTNQVVSQNIDSTTTFKISGYIDTYFAHYTDSLGPNTYQKIVAISPRSNEFGLNIAQFSGTYTSEKLRAVLSLHYGDIPSNAWSSTYNVIQEANAGVRLSKNLWLDAGFFKTHIGTEAVFPKDNIISSLAIITYYEPAFQSGFKLSYTPNDNLFLCVHVLNGYNSYVDNNSFKSVGLTLNYAFDENGNIGYYNLIGDELNSSNNKLRILHNIVFSYLLAPKLKTIIGMDFITQRNSSLKDSTQNANVFGAIITFKYQLSNYLGFYTRFENFSDEDGILSGSFEDAKHFLTGIKSIGMTLGVEFKPKENAFIRLEGRYLELDKDQKIFYKSTAEGNTSSRIETMLDLGIWF